MWNWLRNWLGRKPEPKREHIVAPAAAMPAAPVAPKLPSIPIEQLNPPEPQLQIIRIPEQSPAPAPPGVLDPNHAPFYVAQGPIATRIHFISEQDGPPEAEFKRRVGELLSNEPAVLRAYLARISYGEIWHWSVAICLSCNGPMPLHLVKGIGEIFQSMFVTDFVDILPLTPELEKQLCLVCKRFYGQPMGPADRLPQYS